MFELLINAGKLLMSKESRDTATGLLEVIKRTPEWQRDICKILLRVSRSSKELTHLIRLLCVEKMENLGYDSFVKNSFQTSYVELVTNALEHGCHSEKDEPIEIEADITKAYIALCVRNAKGIVFDLNAALRKAKASLVIYPDKSRGRGLFLVAALADEFEEREDGRTMKALFYRDYVYIETFKFPELTLLRLTSGLLNPSCARRIEEAALAKLPSDVILDLSLWYALDTSIIRTKILHLHRIFKEHKCNFIAIITETFIAIPGSAVTTSLKEALLMIGRSHLLREIDQQMPKLPKIGVDLS